MTTHGLRGKSWRPSVRSCPIDRCSHPMFLHDIDEIDWPRIERCTVADCGCSSLVLSQADHTEGAAA